MSSYDEDEHHYDDDYYDDESAREEYDAEVIESALADLPMEAVREFLGQHGDAIQARVDRCRADATALIDNGFYGAALTAAITACEVIIRFFILRPLVEGAFLSNEWSGVLVSRIVSGRTHKDRELLPHVARHWEIDLDKLCLKDDVGAWKHLVSVLWKRRNAFVHSGETVTENDARSAVETVELLLEEVVAPLAKRAGLSWPDVKWCETGADTHKCAVFEEKDPFGKQ